MFLWGECSIFFFFYPITHLWKGKIKPILYHRSLSVKYPPAAELSQRISHYIKPLSLARGWTQHPLPPPAVSCHPSDSQACHWGSLSSPSSAKVTLVWKTTQLDPWNSRVSQQGGTSYLSPLLLGFYTPTQLPLSKEFSLLLLSQLHALFYFRILEIISICSSVEARWGSPPWTLYLASLWPPPPT